MQMTAEQTAKRRDGVAPVLDDHDLALGPQAAIPGRPDAVSHAVVKKFMGKKHWAAGWVLGLCNADPQFLVHFAEQPRGYVHFLCLIRMALAKRETGDGNAQDDARMLRAANKRKLLKELFPSCPPGIVNLLHKLPKKPLQEEEYRWLICALENDNWRKKAFHAERVRLDAVYFSFSNLTTDFPEQFRHIAMHESGYVSMDEYGKFWAFIKIMQHFDLNISEDELKKISGKMEVIDGLGNWFKRRLSEIPFPPSPWAGNERIRPIRSESELKESAKRFKNCAADRMSVLSVLIGERCFYVCDRPLAMIQVERDVLFGWSVNDILGVKNKTIKPVPKHEIRRAFLKAGFCPVSWGVAHHLFV